MPSIAHWVDDMREAFGKEMIDAQIRKGMKGQATFYASENGHEIGSKQNVGQLIGWHPVTGCAMEVSKRGEE